MTQPTLHDHAVALLYWPALAIVTATILAPFVLPWLPIDRSQLPYWTIGIGGFCVLGFLLVIADADSRNAVNDFNIYMREQWKDWTWSERFFMRVGDIPFTICSRILWLELLVLMFLPFHDLWLLLFAGFGVCVLMCMLTLKKDNSWR